VVNDGCIQLRSTLVTSNLNLTCLGILDQLSYEPLHEVFGCNKPALYM